MGKPKACKICVVLSLFGALLLLFALLFSCVEICIGSRSYFEKTYTKLDNAQGMGMSTEDLTEATWRMIEYMRGNIESIDLDVTVHGETVSMFNDQERVHMFDVRNLFLGLRKAAIAAAAAGILALLVPVFKKRYRECGIGVFLGSGVFLLLLLLLGAWVLVDFNSFWTEFHHVFFTNDLWLFDPATSRMINMMPLELFYGIVTKMGLLFVGMWAGFLLFGFGVWRHGTRKDKP